MWDVVGVLEFCAARRKGRIWLYCRVNNAWGAGLNSKC